MEYVGSVERVGTLDHVLKPKYVEYISLRNLKFPPDTDFGAPQLKLN